MVATCWVFCLLALSGLAGAQESTTPAEDQYGGEGCTTIATLDGNTAKSTEPFGVGNTTLRIVFKTTPANNRGFNSTDISVVDETLQSGGTQIDSTEAFEGEDGVLEVPLEAGRYSVHVETFEQVYHIVVEAEGGTEPCTEVAPSDQGADQGSPSGSSTQAPAPINSSKGVMPGTGAKEIPDTGGPPYLAFGALALLGGALIVGRGALRR